MFGRNVLFLISSIAVVVTAFECGQRVAHSRRKRIANGYDAGHYPWTVFIGSYSHNGGVLEEVCGGSVIGSRWVLTASHCVEDVDVDSIRMTIGETDLQDIDNDKSMVHRKALSFVLFDELHGNNSKKSDSVSKDIAIIELDRPLDFTEHIRPICLPLSADSIYEKGAELVTIGHGNTLPFDAPSGFPLDYNDILQEIKLIADDPAHCKKRLLEALKEKRKNGKEEKSNFDNSALMDEEVRLNICMKEKDRVEGTCTGDSGGPLMLKTSNERWFQFGINAYDTRGECGHPKTVEVYTNVAVYCQLIAVATKNEVTCIDVKA